MSDNDEKASWSPFRKLSDQEAGAIVNRAMSARCTACGEPIPVGARIQRDRATPDEMARDGKPSKKGVITKKYRHLGC